MGVWGRPGTAVNETCSYITRPRGVDAHGTGVIPSQNSRIVCDFPVADVLKAKEKNAEKRESERFVFSLARPN